MFKNRLSVSLICDLPNQIVKGRTNPTSDLAGRIKAPRRIELQHGADPQRRERYLDGAMVVAALGTAPDIDESVRRFFPRHRAACDFRIAHPLPQTKSFSNSGCLSSSRKRLTTAGSGATSPRS